MEWAALSVSCRRRSLALLILTQIAVMSLWFSSAAVLEEMAGEAKLGVNDLAWLSTAVQLGFAFGALAYAILGIPDRIDPRAVFTVSALVSATSTLALVTVPIGGWEAVLLRTVTGAAMAGVYPVGIKIALGWGGANRALLVSILVGALTIGSALPYLIAAFGGADWRVTIWATALFAVVGAIGIHAVVLGPWHRQAMTFDPSAIFLIWRDRRIRMAVLGYIGHMWELFVFWAWVATFAASSYAEAGAAQPGGLGKITAFTAVALGGLACIPAGRLAVRHGSARIARLCLVVSGGAALAAAGLHGHEVWLFTLVTIVWGIAIIPDSALYSTLVADAAPLERAGSLVTIQTALGFLLSAVTVQVAPTVATGLGWAVVLGLLAIGPAIGIVAMTKLIRGPGNPSAR